MLIQSVAVTVPVATIPEEHKKLFASLRAHFGGCALETLFLRAALYYLAPKEGDLQLAEDDLADIERGVANYLADYYEDLACGRDCLPFYLEVVYNKLRSSPS